MSKRYKSRYHAVTKDLLDMLIAKGFRIIDANDGGDRYEDDYTNTDIRYFSSH